MFSPHGPGKEMRRLQHHADPGLDRLLGERGVVPPGDADHASARLVEAAEQAGDGGLPAAGRTHQRDHLALAHPQGKILQHRFAFLIAEGDMVELHFRRAAMPGRRRPDGRRFPAGNRQREGALGRGDGVLHLGKHPRQVLHRPEHEGDVADEGLDGADR